MVGADQDAMPLPPAGPGWFDQNHHHASEQVGRESTKHPPGQKAGVRFEGLKDPFVIERFSAGLRAILLFSSHLKAKTI
jgi:hypothetical protein